MTDRRLLRLSDLPTARAIAFEIVPDADELAALARALGIEAVRKLRFAGTLAPVGRRDWRLDATLGATVVQPCVVTLAPVSTRIDEPVTRTYLAELPDPPPGAEIEMPEDDSIEALPETLDLGQVMAEALALALPAYPRATDAELGSAAFAPPGAEPLGDDDVKPFAGLAGLRDRLKKGH